MRLPLLMIEKILKWADTFHERTKGWPNQGSGPVEGALGEKWVNIDQALVKGLRGLPGGSSLARLLEEKREVRNAKYPPGLAILQILAWVDAFRRRSGAGQARAPAMSRVRRAKSGGTSTRPSQRDCVASPAAPRWPD